MRASEFSFIGAMTYLHPWLGELLQEHLDLYDGLLPHVLLADVERWAEAELSRSAEGQPTRLIELLAFVERGMSEGDAEVVELISVSFLELISRAPEPGSVLREMVGPSCREQLRVIG